ncbi:MULTISPECIES: PP0621 family protein [Burkholderia]|uniref:PP0621 family protein n=1 Tax=Burkholderia TaxID=32008 RepID=UPI00050EC702|nr:MULTISPECIES: PP0621 family protein [Burkholderia]AYQ87245.1 deaminase [Burkholderia gladioli]KGE06852.1 pyrimidine deaminase [Burkholderia gladioli]KVM73205.1 deaminase [Burkholderia gladioli]NBI47266.1 deaminase [Burkholderia sp. ISTR5]
MRNLLLLILLFFAGSWLARKLRQAQERTARDGAAAGSSARGSGGPGFGGAAQPAAGRPASLPEPMVRCAVCGVHTPKGEAIAAAGEYFCCPEHAARQTSSAGRDAS